MWMVRGGLVGVPERWRGEGDVVEDVARLEARARSRCR